MRRKTKRRSSPEAVSLNRKRLINNDTPFAIKESYVKLRTNLMFCMKSDNQGPCKVFAVTSSRPSEGKSLTAANIAISFAMLGKNTILIDADFRKPTQRGLWNIEQSTGLCGFLANLGPLEISRVDSIPLAVVCTGTIPPNPSELLSSEIMSKFVGACAASYDYVIIDTPPVNTVADAQIVSSLVDGMILVARSAETTTEELSVAVESIKRVEGNICGIVLNDLNMKSVNYSYKYKYGKYGDKYGYANDYEYK